MSLVFLKSSIGGYFFDVIFREDYDFENVITSSPVQSGANVSDNAYSQPVTITFDVGISDCLGSIVAGQFDGYPSRAASAFDSFQILWKTRVPLEIDTVIGGHIFPFYPMVIKSMRPSRTKDTMNALRMTIVLQEVILTDAVSQSVAPKNTATSGEVMGPPVPPTSSDPQTTDQTPVGTVTPTPAPDIPLGPSFIP
jgi:hypothetical protein